MNDSVFVVVVNDRHSDIGIKVFADRDDAIAEAKQLAKTYAKLNKCKVTINKNQYWEYFAYYSCEDHVFVQRVRSHEKGK